ncbi:two-component system, NtrC family, response regulator [Amphritea atlantica]|uniref:Two-component system, NtrC family, response regulator n=1 Tax=Amphritea atlantica TaxID=355243 RepID=A0A1H9GNN6_9GAMM|nr:sigma-54 dependent transcriptional regulator [Amphritea atlantica]SEQ51558.1 two-component system, NtrC family, response regulator [Amphritea atlantica]
MSDILIIEDEPVLNENLNQFLSSKGYQVDSADSKATAKALLAEHLYDVILSDMRLPDTNGTELIEHIKEVAPSSIILVMTAYSSLETALDVFHCGAHDYIIKPFPLQEIEHKVANALQYKQLLNENANLRNRLHQDSENLEMLAGSSPQICELRRLINKVAITNTNVLIQGESGTGKELVAQSIHLKSQNAEGLFVPVNVAAIPDGLVESYLFGHIKGSFTGANQTREGAFRMASGGTLFLDEIGEMPLQIQSKLLRVLEDSQVYPVGSDTSVPVDTRIICATHRDLEQMVADGEFREDLWYRLNVVNLQTPPLRERMEDIPALVSLILKRLKVELKRPVMDIDNDVIHHLMNQPLKGNVRELKNILERAAVLCDDNTIRVRDLALQNSDLANLQLDESGSLADLNTAVEKFKQQHIVAALESTEGCRESAARLLGLSTATLYRQLDKLGLKGYVARSSKSVIGPIPSGDEK